MVDDLGMPPLKPGPVLLDHQRLAQARERAGGLDDHEVVDVRVQRAQPDLQPVQLVVDHDEVVDLAALVPRWEGRPVVRGTQQLGLGESEEAIAFE